MKILAPINHISGVEQIAKAGAEEFYVGYQDPAWKKAYGKYSDVNRLTLFCESANYHTIDDIKEFADLVHGVNGKLFVTLNAPGYYQSQLVWIREAAEKLASFGTDGVIISEPMLIPIIKKTGMAVVASTMCGIENSDIANYYLEAGVSRLILPRELTVDEIESMIANSPEAEYEVFLMRNGCRYLDANCLGIHGGEKGALCADIRYGNATIHCRRDSADLEASLVDTHWKFAHDFHEHACGLCAIYRLLQAGVTAVKIVGRMDPAEDIARDVAITAENIAIAQGCKTEYEYFEKMKLPGDPDVFCRNGFSCYYPEIRWG